MIPACARRPSCRAATRRTAHSGETTSLSQVLLPATFSRECEACLGGALRAPRWPSVRLAGPASNLPGLGKGIQPGQDPRCSGPSLYGRGGGTRSKASGTVSCAHGRILYQLQASSRSCCQALSRVSAGSAQNGPTTLATGASTICCELSSASTKEHAPIGQA